MAANNLPFREQFFRSIDDAAQMLRLFDFLPDVYLYVKDINGRFVAMNEAQVRLKGVTHEHELLGKTDLDLHSAHWGKLYQEEDRRVMSSGREIPHQIWLVSTADGTLGTFCSSKIPVRGSDGEVVGIAGVMYRLDQEPTKLTRDDPVQQATELITQHFFEPIEINEIADSVGLSTSQLNRRFRSTFQMPPSEYLQRVRVHEASRRLASSDHAIGEVALQVGFYDQAHLTRTFKRFMGMTPSEFRKLPQD